MSTSLVDDLLQVKGALGALVLASGSAIFAIWRRQDSLDSKLTEIDHKIDLAVQRFQMLIDHLGQHKGE